MKGAYAWLVCSLAGIAGFALLAYSPTTSNPLRTQLLVIAIDCSDSASEEVKLEYGRNAMELIERLSPAKDQLLMLRFDGECSEICSEIPADLESFTFVLRDHVLRPPRAAKTRPALVFDHLAGQLAKRNLKGQEVRVCVLTDGGNDDRSGVMEAKYGVAVASLSALPQLAIVEFRGVRPGLREEIRSRFQELDMQGKLRLLGPGEAGND